MGAELCQRPGLAEPLGEHPQFRAAKARCIDNAAVDQFVDHDHVIGIDQGANQSESRCVAAGEGNRRLRAFERSDGLLQFMVRRQRTADETGRA